MRANHHQSPDASLPSPDSSYAAEGGTPPSCRKSPRLLANGYYGSNMNYMENPVRVFRRRRRRWRPRTGQDPQLLSDVTLSVHFTYGLTAIIMIIIICALCIGVLLLF